MRFLIDENLSSKIAEFLEGAGHEAMHVRHLGAASASDAELIAIAADQDRIIVSADTDFGALLAVTRATKPSVLLMREIVDRKPVALVRIILDHLDMITSALKSGAIVAFTSKGIRVRPLPLR